FGPRFCPSPRAGQRHSPSAGGADFPLPPRLLGFCCRVRFGLCFSSLCGPSCLRSSTHLCVSLRADLLPLPPAPPRRFRDRRSRLRRSLLGAEEFIELILQ